MPPLFDMELRARRRDRAARRGPEPFLFERAFEDCLERVGLVRRRFADALLVGCPDPQWPKRLRAVAETVDVRDPGPLFAAAAGGRVLVEDDWPAPPGPYDLVLAIGTLDTVNELPLALRLIHHAMRPDGLFIGAMSGGSTLPQLRSAMRAADQASGEAAAHVHPRIEAAALAPLLTAAGFANPVVDVDRVPVSYASLDRLVDDLRSMGGTNILSARRRRGLSRAERAAAARAFSDAGSGGRTIETYEILHFAGWTPVAGEGAEQQ
ncbi:MAG: methyltransferase domain-containing protein [Sphingomicrobium sp.]